MQTHLSSEFQGTADGEEAQAIIRKMRALRFLHATCPTINCWAIELDGPRGRIY